MPKIPYGSLPYNCEDDLENAISSYFDLCDNNNKPPTMAGLALYINITRKQLTSFNNSDRYGDIIARARERVRSYAEGRLFDRDGANGAKFWLINNDAYSERHEIDIQGGLNVNIIDDIPE